MHKAVDPEDEFFHAAEGSASDGLPCNPVEPDLHLVKPGRVGGRVEGLYDEPRPGAPRQHQPVPTSPAAVGDGPAIHSPRVPLGLMSRALAVQLPSWP